MKLLAQKEDKVLSEDVRIFKQIASGDQAALEKFYVKYYKHLYRFALSYERDVFIVEEKISDVFFYLWHRKDELHKILNPKVYVFTMTKNLLFQEKKLARMQALNGDFKSFEANHYADNVEDQIILNEQEEKIRKSLYKIVEKIPPKSRRIFEMSRIDGLKYKQIAEILNLSVRTVENQMSIALRTIEYLLAKQLD
ncbi:sigma-70 family RNA polymerase sigma factor [Flavobacterium sp. JP2137]|uniref:sigma-70 family RNA polymerase sigma factor n=1 Tax=Flavobacterium sp. JP2137 TaxID=3414510 RepID=UPI003D3008D4